MNPFSLINQVRIDYFFFNFGDDNVQLRLNA